MELQEDPQTIPTEDVQETTGAYLEPMAANFNALPRPGSVMIDEGKARLIKRHETVDDVFARDIIE